MGEAAGETSAQRYTYQRPALRFNCVFLDRLVRALQLTPKGTLLGRVLTESLRGHENDSLPKVEHRTQESDPSFNGLKTVLQTEVMGAHTYYDAAGVLGRTVGLEEKPR